MRFPREQHFLSWAIVGGGFHSGSAVLWRQVRNKDLPPDLDPQAFLQDKLSAAGHPNAVGLLTSASLSDYSVASRHSEGLTCTCVATVGLSNALAAGDPDDNPTHYLPGTINILVAVSAPLEQNALVEALSIATEARSSAVLLAQVPSIRSGAPATGTGTDCIVVASPKGDAPLPYAGKHTKVGSLIGQAVVAATNEGIAAWRVRMKQRAQ